MLHEENTVYKNWQDLHIASWISIVSHAVAGLSLLTILSHGLQTNNDIKSRIDFLAYHTPFWLGGWFTWNIAALSILYFFICLSRAYEPEKMSKISLLRLSVFIVCAAVAIDLSTEAVEMLFLPDIAHQIIDSGTQSTVQQFLNVSRLTVLLTGYLANGLYTTATLLACISIRNCYPKMTTLFGLLVVISGFALSYCSVISNTDGLFWSNVILVPAILLWQTGIAFDANNRIRRVY